MITLIKRSPKARQDFIFWQRMLKFIEEHPMAFHNTREPLPRRYVVNEEDFLE